MTTLDATVVKTVTVQDPDTNSPVQVVIVKLSTGGMMGVDASFLHNTEQPVWSCYDYGVNVNIEE